MTATIAKLGIALEAQTAELRRGFKNATGAIKQLDSRVAGIAGGFAKATVAIGAAIAVFKSLKGAIDQTRRSWDELSSAVDVANRLGTTTQELEFLNFAASQLGISANSVSTSLQRMGRRVSEAAKGSGEAKDAIRELGLDAARLSRQSPAATFQEIQQALAGVENQSDRVRLAFKLFDAEGADLVRFADIGVEGMRDLQDQFNELGGSIAHNADKLKAAEEASARLTRAWRLLWGQFAQIAAPAIEAVSDLLAKFLGLLNKLSGRSRDVEVVNELTEAEKRLDKATGDFAKQVEESNKQMEEQRRQLDELKKRGEAITKSLQTPAERARDAVAELNKLWSVGAISLETYQRGVERAKESLIETRDVVEDIVKGPGIATAASGGFSAKQAAIREQQKRTKLEEQQLAEARRMRQLLENFNVKAIQI